MIHKSRKLLAHCLAPVSRSLAFRFCSKPLDEDLQILEGKAFLSYKIIKEIENPQFNVEQKSLRQHLVDLIDSKTEVPSPSREFMKSMFTTGIEIDKSVFNQQRITSVLAQNPQNQKGVFIFCPTRLVTTQMFDSIQNNQESNTLFMGHYGISKSISVMLYTILSNHIAEYKFKTYGKNPTPLASQIGDSPKVVYYNLQQFSRFEDIIQSILNQCHTQIGTDKKYSLRNFLHQKNDRTFLKRYYGKKNIDVILFLDQISKIVDAEKRASVKKANKKTVESIQNFKHVISLLSPQFNSIHYLSSVEIQRDRIEESFKLLGGQQGHEPLVQLQIPYLEKILMKDSAFQLIDLYLFQVQRNFKIPLLAKDFHLTSEQVPEEFRKYLPANSLTINLQSLIRNYLTSKLIESEGYIITFLSIRQALRMMKNEKMQILQTFDSVQHIDELIKMLENQLKLLIQASHAQVRASFNRFLKKQQQFSGLTDQQRSIIVFQLYKSASAFKGSADKQNLYTIAIESDFQRTTMKQVLPHISKNLFKVDEQGIKTYIPPKLLKSILQPYIEQTLVYFFKHDANRFKKDSNMKSFSNNVELIFVRMVCQSKPTIKLPFHSKKQETIQFNIQVPKTYAIESIELTNLNKIKNGKKMYEWPFVTDINDIIAEEVKYKNQKTFQKDFFLSTNEKFRLHTNEQLQNILTGQALRNNLNNGIAIDFMILSLMFNQDQNPRVRFTAFDMTTGDAKYQKIFKFAKVFADFKHKSRQMMEFGGRKVEMSLDFFVICPGPEWKKNQSSKSESKYEYESESKHKPKDKKLQSFKECLKEMETKLNLDYDKDIDDNASICKIKSFKKTENGKEIETPSLLKRVGYVSIGKDLVIESESESETIKQNPDAGIKHWRLIEAILQNKI